MQLVRSWRSDFSTHGGTHPAVPFAFVQLSDWPGNDTQISDTRFAQEKALALSNVSQAVAADIGDTASPNAPIHPPNKQEVGRRLALALCGVEGPSVAGVEVHQWNESWGDFHAATGHSGLCQISHAPYFVKCTGIRLRFSQPVELDPIFAREIRTGFEAMPPPNPKQGCGSPGPWQPVAITSLSADGLTLQLNVTIQGGYVAFLRYGWGAYPTMPLYSKQWRLPLPPFNMSLPLPDDDCPRL